MVSTKRSSLLRSFDPASLKTEVKNTTISQLITMLQKDLIDLQPDFQRHANLWTTTKKSQFIESVLLGLPMPSFFFYVDQYSQKWVIIDGLQRLCALIDFAISKKLSLKGLELLQSYEGKRFDDLSYIEQLNFSMRGVSLNLISGQASAEAKYIIFKRLNTGGMHLRPAEIRNALFHGPVMDLVRELACSELFRKATDYSVSENHLLHFDFISRFLTFYVLGTQGYESNKMDLFIGNGLQYIYDCYGSSEMSILKRKFYDALQVCVNLLGKEVFRNPLSNRNKKKVGDNSNPVSIALFEAMMVSVANLSENESMILVSRKEKYGKLYRKLLGDPCVNKQLSDGKNTYKSVIFRFQVFEDLVRQILK